jgi:hypothetical protein
VGGGYRKAIGDDGFWRTVKHNFMGLTITSRRKELVRSKFVLAGTSARFMFQLTIREIRDAVNEYVDPAGNSMISG